ncbi:hypothetical protein [Melittangium boletus]|uniref:Uncharacterized protein n=1 Tax=Melittangium boletus DSM 14713 TaxID=1294270 RepID=A0A250IDB5_9BACT|nr:hypothetical protein [Melittangium boletus]ATB29117.1 hypothetical protein MEBOL_002566 [Melittangium boletus DSM 14713]
MGVIWTPLTLIQPNLADGTEVEFPRLPPNIPRRIEQGTRTLSVGLLVGEKLGLDLSELTECLNTVWFGPPAEAKGMFLDDDAPILIEGFTRIRDALRAAIDEQGRPRGPGGALLKASPSIEQYSDGGMVTKSRRVLLLDLLKELDALLPFLRFAQEHMLFIVEGEWPRPKHDEG